MQKTYYHRWSLECSVGVDEQFASFLRSAWTGLGLALRSTGVC